MARTPLSVLRIPQTPCAYTQSLNFFSIFLPPRFFLRRDIPTVLRKGRATGRQTPVPAQGLGNDPLKLTVYRTELVGRPLLQCLHRRTAHAQHKTLVLLLFFRHVISSRLPAQRLGTAFAPADEFPQQKHRRGHHQCLIERRIPLLSPHKVQHDPRHRQ